MVWLAREYSESGQTSYIRKPRQLVDVETGEVIEAEQVIKRVYGQRQFWKLYLADFLQILGLLESKQLDVLIYILEHTQPSNNTFIGTFAKISGDCSVSMDTVRRTMKKLKDAGFLLKVQNGVYVVSPDIMMKGSDGKKRLLLEYYDMALGGGDDENKGGNQPSDDSGDDAEGDDD